MRFLLFFLLLLTHLAVAQPSAKADFINASADLAIDPAVRTVTGSVTYTFKLAKLPDTISIDAINMKFTNVRINGKNVGFKSAPRALKLFDGYRKGTNTLTFEYTAQPKQTMYFVDAGDYTQIWTQGQGKYTSHWFPSFDDTNEKVIFNLSITHEKGFTVLANGVLKSKEAKGNQAKWNYTMMKPMSSYLLMLAIGKFDHQKEVSASGVPLEYFIESADRNKLEPTYRYSKKMFDFLEKEIGVAYPWEVYRQVPVRDFLYGGMENTTATVFTTDFVVDSVGFNDRNYVNVNAHELAHQWFGDMVTATSGEHHWLQEGFATYYALLCEKEVFGENYFYQKLYETAGALQHAARTDTIPVMNAMASSLTFYQKGAWALHVLREGMGADKFRVAVKNYLQKHQFTNVTTDDFLAEVDKESDFDTDAFKRKWLQSGGFDVREAIALLKKNQLMRDYFALLDKSVQPFEEKRGEFERLFRDNADEYLLEEVVMQLREVPFNEKKELLMLAMQTGNVKVRQAVAKTLNPVPADFVEAYATLLDDASYVTQEIAMHVLWTNFPDRRHQLLDKTNGRVGLNDRNLRILWLTLAMATPDYHPQDKQNYYDELLAYAQPGHESPVRRNAIETLLFLDENDRNVLKPLINATTHHKWQFTQFARAKLRDMIKKPNHRKYFDELLPQLPENEQTQLSKLLNE